MTALRRVTALVTALLLLQLTLVGGSAACMTHAQGADAAGSDHSEMSMGSSVGSASEAGHSAVASNATSSQLGGSAEWHGATSEDAGCPAHHSTGPCDSMAACAPVVLGATIAGMSIVAAPAARAIPSRVLTPQTRTTAPELPPPRS